MVAQNITKQRLIVNKCDFTQTLTIIFKPTFLCNLHCKYCYEENERNVDVSKMTLEESQKAFDWILTYCIALDIKQISVIWHGGEPLLMGVDFINATIAYYTALFKSHSIGIKNLIQTNLTLVTGEFFPLFRSAFNSTIGFSFDFESQNRCYPDGSDASNVIFRNALVLKKEGFHVGAIAMMAAENVYRIENMYQWFKEHDIPFSLHRIFPATSATSHSCANAVSSKQYAHAICKLFDIWLKDPQPSDIGTVSEFVLSFLCGKSSICCLTGSCPQAFLCVAPSGILLPCDLFDSDSYVLGNYYTDSVSKVLERKREISKLGLSKCNHEKCSLCEYKNMCHSGCLHSRLYGWAEEECIANKIIWNHIEKTLTPMGLTKGIFKKDSTRAILRKSFSHPLHTTSANESRD